MYKSKVLVCLILWLYILFTVLEFSGLSAYANISYALVVPVVTVMYSLFIKKKDILFLLFLLFFSMSNLLGIIVESLLFTPTSTIIDIDYFIGNFLYIFAYLFLFIKISKSLSIIHILRNFKINLIILTILNIYLAYVLQVVISPHLEMNADYYVEMLYNIILLLLLSASMLNYFYRDNRGALYLFIGAFCLVFSEVIGLAHYYITERSLLSFMSVTLNLLAFYFLYQQAKLLSEVKKENQYIAQR